MDSNKRAEGITLRDYLTKYNTLKRVKSANDLHSRPNPPSIEEQFTKQISELIKIIQEKLKDEKARNIVIRKIDEIKTIFSSAVEKWKNPLDTFQTQNFQSAQQSYLNSVSHKNLITLPQIPQNFQLNTQIGEGSSHFFKMISQSNFAGEKKKPTGEEGVKESIKLKAQLRKRSELTKHKSASGIPIHPIEQKDNEGEVQEKEMAKSKSIKPIPKIAKKISIYENLL